MSRRQRTRGNALVEFTFVGISLMFVLISIFEASRGMWIYTTMAHALKEGARYAAVRGTGFTQACIAGANCTLTVGDVAREIRLAGAGLVPTDVINVNIAGNGFATLQAAETSATVIALNPGQPVTITADYNFLNAISMFWPGAGPGVNARAFNLPASAEETVQF